MLQLLQWPKQKCTQVNSYYYHDTMQFLIELCKYNGKLRLYEKVMQSSKCTQLNPPLHFKWYFPGYYIEVFFVMLTNFYAYITHEISVIFVSYIPHSYLKITKIRQYLILQKIDNLRSNQWNSSLLATQLCTPYKIMLLHSA